MNTILQYLDYCEYYFTLWGSSGVKRVDNNSSGKKLGSFNRAIWGGTGYLGSTCCVWIPVVNKTLVMRQYISDRVYRTPFPRPFKVVLDLIKKPVNLRSNINIHFMQTQTRTALVLIHIIQTE